MSKENDRIAGNIACLDTLNMPATLISTRGFHCDVWRSTGFIVEGGERLPLDIVIKRHLEPCSFREVVTLNKEYRELKSKLDDMVPDALFVSTKIDGVDNVVVIAEAVTPWFNIANPANEEETIPLLRHLPMARSQLRQFVETAKAWHNEQNMRIIDLYGIDNLILDVNRNVKYIDSFRIFFYGDLLYVVDEVDDDLKVKMEIALERRDYLEYVIRESRIARIPPMHF